MVNYYDELEIEDFVWDNTAQVFHYPCPCGDRFEISKAQLRNGEEIATCPSCSLIVRVIYDYLDYEDYETSDEEDVGGSEASATPETSPSPPAKEDEKLVKQMERLETKDAEKDDKQHATVAKPDDTKST